VDLVGVTENPKESQAISVGCRDLVQTHGCHCWSVHQTGSAEKKVGEISSLLGMGRWKDVKQKN